MQRSETGITGGAYEMETGSRLLVRRATENDISAIEALENRCFASPWSYESLYHDIIENKLAFYLVAEEDGKVCGYVGVWKIFDEGHITNVAVAPEYRRRHIASAMLCSLTDILKDNGVCRYTLEVRSGNEPAKALYAMLGFEEAGVRKGYYEDNGEDAIIMWKVEE